MRVVVCGSRDFADRDFVEKVLNGLVGLGLHTVIDGQCPYGGTDQLAHEWAVKWDMTTKRYPPASRTAADYHARDRAMVDSAPDLVVAIVNKPLIESRGTAYTVGYARSKGIPTAVVEWHA